MAYNKIALDVTAAYTSGSLNSEDFGILKRLIIASDNDEFATQSAAEDTLSNWLDKIVASTTPQLYPFPLTTNQTDESEDAVVEDVSRLEKIFIASGHIVLQLRLTGKTALGVYQQLAKFNGREPYAYLCMEGGHIRGYSVAGTKFQAIPTTQFQVIYKEATATTKQHVMVTIGMDAQDLQDSGVWIKPTTFDPITELFGIKPVEMSIITQTTAAITVKLEGAYDSDPIIGDLEDGDLALGDFTLDSTTQAATATMTNNQDGTVTFNPTTVYASGPGTVDLNAPSTTSQRYAQTAQLAFTIP
jgi:hypothetical protein